MKIKEYVENIGLNFAFPSQSIYIEKIINLIFKYKTEESI